MQARQAHLALVPSACSCTRLTLKIGFQCNANTANKDTVMVYVDFLFLLTCNPAVNCWLAQLWYFVCLVTLFNCGKESSAETHWKRALLIQTIQSFEIGHTWDGCYRAHKPKETNSWWKWKSVCQSPLVMTKAASIVSTEVMLPCWDKNWLDNQKLENYGGWELPQVTQQILQFDNTSAANTHNQIQKCERWKHSNTENNNRWVSRAHRSAEHSSVC